MHIIDKIVTFFMIIIGSVMFLFLIWFFPLTIKNVFLTPNLEFTKWQIYGSFLRYLIMLIISVIVIYIGYDSIKEDFAKRDLSEVEE